MTALRRYIVIGAGAVGGAIGARLFQAGHEVVLVARGAHRAAIEEHGLRLSTPADSHLLPIRVIGDPQEVDLGVDDVLIVAVKTQDSIAALDAWSSRPLPDDRTAGQGLPLVCAQNGVEGERLAARRFERVYGMCVFLPASFMEPGKVSVIGDPIAGVLTVGRYPRGVDATVESIAADLTGARFRSTAVEDVMAWKYGKLLANLGNALEAVCGSVDGDAADALLVQLHDEGVQVLQAAGIDTVAPELEARERRYLRLSQVPGEERGGGSSWQSLARGTGTIETDYLSGEIVLLGRLHGVPTPANLTLQILAAAAAQARSRPGQLTIGQVTALVAQAGGG